LRKESSRIMILMLLSNTDSGISLRKECSRIMMVGKGG